MSRIKDIADQIPDYEIAVGLSPKVRSSMETLLEKSEKFRTAIAQREGMKDAALQLSALVNRFDESKNAKEAQEISKIGEESALSQELLSVGIWQLLLESEKNGWLIRKQVRD